MIVLDSNVFIYMANGQLAADILRGQTDVAYATISKIEALGFHRVTAAEQLQLEAIFSASMALELSSAIVNQAVSLRQQKSMSLGDAIIAATALAHDVALWTANVDDFRHVTGLRLVDPFTL